MRRSLARSVALAAGLVLIGALAHILFSGAAWIAPGEVLSQLWQGDTGQGGSNLIIWRIRIPRACAAVLAGALLGLVGAAFQAVFRNDLAEPFVLGVASGAGLGGTLVLLAGLGSLLVLAGSVAGGVGSLLLVLALAGAVSRWSASRTLLAGVVIGAMLSSLMTLALALGGEDAGIILRWMLGSTTPMSWDRVAIMAAGLLILGPAIFSQSRWLNAYAADETLAQRLGGDPRRIVWLVVVGGTVLASLAVGSVGIIPFVGLLAPHAARLMVGSDNRKVLPLAAAAGSLLLIVADIGAQRIKPGFELPIGAVTAALGAPALLWLLRKRQSA